tara:strand:+ start:1816 stop:2001 length:186 start_codon:yes stop_codon:yes gene_type:complete
MAKTTSPQDLIRLHKARQRLKEKNARRPVHLRQTKEQIEKSTRRALDEGRINDYGFILKKE